MLKRLRSQRLTLVLLALLAATAGLGTFLPRERPAGPDLYRSPLFVFLLLLLAVNILLCTWHRFSRSRKKGGRDARGRELRVVLDAVMHLSVIVILLGGAVKGLFATVRTGYLFVETETDTVYDWRSETEVPLGFTLLLRERVDEYYPLQARVGVSDSGTGEKLALLEMREGENTPLPGSDLKVTAGKHDRDEKWIAVRAEAGDRAGEFRLETVPGGRTSADFGEYRLTLVGWRSDLKRVRGRVAVLDGGREVKEQWLAPNGRLGYGGTSVFLTAWGEDEYRNPYLGIQVTRDPGALPFWIGATMLGVTLPLFVAVRSRGRGGGDPGG